MILTLLKTFLPQYFKQVWNQEFIRQMEKTRSDLHSEFPNNPDIVDKRVDEAIARHLK